MLLIKDSSFLYELQGYLVYVKVGECSFILATAILQFLTKISNLNEKNGTLVLKMVLIAEHRFATSINFDDLTKFFYVISLAT